jgi:hypothetical protein
VRDSLLTPVFFFSFPQTYENLKGKRFNDAETIEPSAAEQLLAIPKTEFPSAGRKGGTSVPWCLLSSSWVGMGGGGDSDSRKGP